MTPNKAFNPTAKRSRVWGRCARVRCRRVNAGVRPRNMSKAIRGDLLNFALDGRFDAIVHGCNCMCVMGAGIARQVRSQFPEAYEADLQTPKGSRDKMGTISWALVRRGDHAFHVVNAYTQFDWRGSGNKADYDALEITLFASDRESRYSYLRVVQP